MALDRVYVHQEYQKQMVIQTDYRTNRADYAIAAKPKLTGTAVAAEAKKKAVRRHDQLDDQRSARLSANPSDTSDKPEPRSRG
ncbi:hypothetical protein [Mesorhizobium sp. 128a]